jgi:tetratricopeptide (TPR) repeat protein
LGSCLTYLGRENEALQVYQQALQLDPANHNLWISIGNTVVRCSRYEEAEAWFNAVLAADAGNAGASCGLGDVRREQQRPRDAIPLYEQAIRVDPKLSAYKGLADAHSDCGKYDRAQEILRDASIRFPNDPEAHTRYASALGTAGEFERAVAECREALRLRPNYIEAWTQLVQQLAKR